MRESREPSFRLYIDESGHHSYKHLDDPAKRYLALLGVWFKRSDDYVEFADDLDSFKKEFFGPRPDEPVILHRGDIINKRGPFQILREAVLCKRFNARLLELLAASRFTMIVVIIDKKDHLERYTTPDHPYHYCLAAMLDRYCGWLEHVDDCGDVVVEARGRMEDRLLAEEFRHVFDSGTRPSPNSCEHRQQTLTSREIKLRLKSDNIAGLQLADILAHPVKQVCLCEAGLIPQPAEFFGK
jgi:hypothetical protein